MKLFIDDVRQAPEGWQLARTITEAVRILSGPIYVEAVSLDHDISQSVFGSTELETYATVARFIALLPFERLPKAIYFHTGNPAGANEDMKNILKGLPYQVIDIENYWGENLKTGINYKDELIRLENERELNVQESKWEGEF